MVVVHLDPTHSAAWIIGGRQNCRDATTLFEQIDLGTTRKIDPATGRIAPKPRDRDQVTVGSSREERSSRGIESDTGKTKVEWLVRPRFVAVRIMEIAKCDPSCQFASVFEVQLVPNHFPVSERLCVIGAG